MKETERLKERFRFRSETNGPVKGTERLRLWKLTVHTYCIVHIIFLLQNWCCWPFKALKFIVWSSRHFFNFCSDLTSQRIDRLFADAGSWMPPTWSTDTLWLSTTRIEVTYLKIYPLALKYSKTSASPDFKNFGKTLFGFLTEINEFQNSNDVKLRH